MTDEGALWRAFKAGFQATGEGFNGEYPPATEDQIRDRFEWWNCDDHEYSDWRYVKDNHHGNRELYRKGCIHCGHTRQEWRDA